MRNFINSHKLLAGVLALVLVAGMTSPAFAQLESIASPETISILPPIDEEDEIFDNGRGDLVVGAIDMGSFNLADDFVLETPHV